MPATSLFEGPRSLREPSERLAFWLTGLSAFPVALLIGYVLHESIGASQVALFIVLAMVYVTLARGRLLGSSVRVHEAQYPRAFAIVRRTCAALHIPVPLVFVREDNNVPVVALGFGEPYALVLSSHWIETFTDDELAFMIGRELGHVAAGHTRFHSLLSVNGNENPLIALIFGAWLRRCALTCDRVGLLCCGSLDAAIRAMGVAAFHEFGRRVDLDLFAEQHAEVQADSVLRWGEWLSSEPYATRRIASLRRFIQTPAYVDIRAALVRSSEGEPPELALPGESAVSVRDCSGWWRRFAACSVDVVLVSAMITSFGGHVAPVARDRPDAILIAPGTVDVSVPGLPSVAIRAPRKPKNAASPKAETDTDTETQTRSRVVGITVPSVFSSLWAFAGGLGVALWLPLYLAFLVIVAGQTVGMMVAGLRVVTTDFRRPGIFRAIGRYTIVFLLWWLIVPLSFLRRRILLHDRWTKTRVVKVESIIARVDPA